MTDDNEHEWRYSDRPTTSVRTDISGTAASVWALISDISVPPTLSSEVQETVWLEGFDAPAVGARFQGRNQHQAIGEWQVVCTITACEPEQAFEWCVGEPDHPSAVWRFTIEPGESGHTVTLEQHFQMGPAPSGLSPAIAAMPDKESRIIARRLAEHEKNMAATVQGIKALVEGSDPA